MDLGVLLEAFLDVVINLAQLVFGDSRHHFPKYTLLEVGELDGCRVFVGKQVAVRFVALDKFLPLLMKVGVERIAVLTEDARVRLRAGETSWFLQMLSIDGGGLGKRRGGGFCVVVKPPPDLLHNS